MGRTRVALIFNDDNEEQRTVCEYLKSQPRTKTALITQLVLAWIKTKGDGSPVFAGEPTPEQLPSVAELKEQITTELLQDKDFIKRVIDCISAEGIQPAKEDVSEENETEEQGFDFDEDMLLSGMSMFEAAMD